MNLKKFLGLSIAVLLLANCSSNPHKAEEIETNMEKKQEVGGGAELGIKDGNMVVQKKVIMAEELRTLQYDVYGLEDRVYGNRKYGSLGIYGVLRTCRSELSDKKNGGDGKLIWTEPIDRVTEKEEDLKIGIDEKEQLVGVSEEFLKDRIERFKKYQKILRGREDEYEEKLSICKAELASRKHDMEQQNKAKN